MQMKREQRGDGQWGLARQHSLPDAKPDPPAGTEDSRPLTWVTPECGSGPTPPLRPRLVFTSCSAKVMQEPPDTMALGSCTDEIFRE